MTKKDQDLSAQPPIITLLTGAAGAFGAGLLGAIWHTKKKQNQRIETEIKEGIKHIPHRFIPPKLTPEELAVAKKEATMFAFKTLGLGTLLAFTGAGIIAKAVSWWLDVHSFKEFSDTMQLIVPRKTSRLRQMLGGKKFEVTKEEEEELKEFDIVE
ncbi:hypothetical protein G6F70_008556 [Rhizopus microsporus]|uniref:Transmembrane protein 242 n=2 Tax=Rhizopus TaxID=4842 RepID=A0A367JM94_RHIAZ|nr:hypothetical protein G6F71_008543 [Rhizopus microsporus]RCH91064.1 hypothetical protein CU097_008517 [Rhizopus azygosporus]KAG1195018.1 hypothetical protein G6F70_008556 [Rhizopus microsporus]KAG1206863.1 hypothetical protein G6F69_008507 [Rhizopus microsporus]KAG1227433.1 hypothetical protein G6F67_008453 [Rhizopus microsporus]